MYTSLAARKKALSYISAMAVTAFLRVADNVLLVDIYKVTAICEQRMLIVFYW